MPVEYSASDDEAAPNGIQEDNTLRPGSSDISYSQESTISSFSPNNSPVRTRNYVRPAPIDTGIALADSAEGDPSPMPSPPSIHSVGTEEKMTMVENMSRVHSTRRANRSAAFAEMEQAIGYDGGALFHSTGYRPGPGFPPRMGRPPLSPTPDPPEQGHDDQDGVAESAATSNSGKYMSPEEISLKQEEESFYSAPPNKAGDDNIWGLLSGVMGNVYEW
jgi:hypothetical protein